MDEPLGRTVGNRLEVEEAWQVLQGEGPGDVREVTLALAAELLPLADLGVDAREARARAEAALDDGRAAEHFERWCYVQGGRWHPGEFHRLAGREVKAPRAGYVTAADALAIGRAAQVAGAGRRTVDDAVDPAAGVLLEHAVGDRVEAGEPARGRVLARPGPPPRGQPRAGGRVHRGRGGASAAGRSSSAGKSDGRGHVGAGRRQAPEAPP